jgi:hypothetical protein
MPRRAAAVLTLAVTAGAVTAAPAIAPAQSNPRLVSVRTFAHPGFDRVVFVFRGGLPATRRVEFVPRLVQDGSGFVLPVPGRAILRVSLSFADAHDQRGRPTSQARLSPAMRNVMRVERAGDFEAIVTYGIGLAARRPVTVRTRRNPDRVFVDIDNRYPAVRRRVYLLDLPRFARGREPAVRPVLRFVPAGSPASGALHRLYAGPTPAEYRRGLRFVASRSTGFTGLTVSGRVARLRLTGGCSSGGSTVTVASLIRPTLRQFPTVRGVVIRDPSGGTGPTLPDGSSSPDCLEP